MSEVHFRRLGGGDLELARRMFAAMAAVFEEPSARVSDGYLARLLGRPDFWAVVALAGDQVAGGLTAHTLPMTRSESSEVFIYDLAVRQDFRRRGVGRGLVAALLEGARAEGIETAFVPADNEDAHALEFYRAVGGVAQPATFFNFGTGEAAGRP